MGMQASIDINFAKEYSPKEILKNLIYSGWEFDYQGSVSYLLPSDIDDYDWQFIDKNDFDIEEFISSHYDKDKIGIVMIIDRISGGNMLIYPDYLSLSLSINRHYLSESETIPDFNWYLKRLNIFLNTIKLSSIQCEIIY